MKGTLYFTHFKLWFAVVMSSGHKQQARDVGQQARCWLVGLGFLASVWVCWTTTVPVYGTIVAIAANVM